MILESYMDWVITGNGFLTEAPDLAKVGQFGFPLFSNHCFLYLVCAPKVYNDRIKSLLYTLSPSLRTCLYQWSERRPGALRLSFSDLRIPHANRCVPSSIQVCDGASRIRLKLHLVLDEVLLSWRVAREISSCLTGSASGVYGGGGALDPPVATI